MRVIPEAFNVQVGHEQYRVVQCPDPITCGQGLRYHSEIDHDQKVIWIDPGLPLDMAPKTIASVVSAVWAEWAEIPREVVEVKRRKRIGSQTLEDRWYDLAPQWPFPPRLPEDADLRPLYGQSGPMLPINNRHIYCPICGAQYCDRNGVDRHVVKVHGWHDPLTPRSQQVGFHGTDGRPQYLSMSPRRNPSDPSTRLRFTLIEGMGWVCPIVGCDGTFKKFSDIVCMKHLAKHEGKVL